MPAWRGEGCFGCLGFVEDKGGEEYGVFLGFVLGFPHYGEGGFGFGDAVAFGLELCDALEHGGGEICHVCALVGDEIAVGVA